MPRLFIDGREITVPGGTKVIDAAERLGIVIPRFCYHEALGSLGACRMCAVTFLEGPVNGVQMSCMIEARDGMVVSTTHPEAVDFRRHVIEWLMMNHPHDCPVCDEGGHCLLQDETVSGGHALRRFRGAKRTFHDQGLGPFVQHEMNRCIHCWRCRRFYREFSGYRDYGALGIAGRTYFGRLASGSLESPFSGNLIDLCPTGALTDRPSRYVGRRWEYQRGPSLCIHCSLGCATTASARYRQTVRLEAGRSNEVNGWFICDRGRWGFAYDSLPERPRSGTVDGREVPAGEAVKEAAARLGKEAREGGPGAVATASSTRASLETILALRDLSCAAGWRPPACFSFGPEARATSRAVARLDARVAVSLREIESADFILAVGTDPVNEAPMLALAMRQAVRRGAVAAVIDPRPVALPFDFLRMAVPPGEIEHFLSAVLAEGVGDASLGGEASAVAFRRSLAGAGLPVSAPQSPLAAVARALAASSKPVIVCGTGIVRFTTPDLAADAAFLLRQAGKDAGLFYILPGPNAFGAILAAGPGNMEELVEGIEKGEVRALMVAEGDPFSTFPDGGRLAAALGRLDLLVAMDYLPSRLMSWAHVVIPTRPLHETVSTFVNQEGRAQRADAVHGGGLPVVQEGGGHPPRIFRSAPPGSGPMPAWEALDGIGRSLLGGEGMETGGDRLILLGEGGRLRLVPDKGPETPFAARPLAGDGRGGVFELLLVELTFGAEELSSYSPLAVMAESSPTVMMRAEEAASLGLAPGDRVRLSLDGGELEAVLEVDGGMAEGVVILPRHRELAWQKVAALPSFIPRERVRKAVEEGGGRMP